ncbi:MAG: phage/plasmid primase, P4 family [Candidatus Poribacteria bacterium]|nr:phage/plasmid primase, P4 family [Candidatus Poribacteria bacterium]
MREHDQENNITKLAEYDYDKDASCPRWDQFLLEIMDGSEEMSDFLQLVSGYGATGSVREQALFMCYGAGSNGKSTFCETLLELISDYSESVTHDFFALNKTDTHMTAVADMVGKRFVIGSEFTGNRMNEPMIKRLTGGDTIKARRMRQDYFQFKPTHSFFILVNDRPNIVGTDEGIWRRLKLIPFPRYFSKEERDEDLKDKLMGEAEGILNWLVKGTVRWFENGLDYPVIVEGVSDELAEPTWTPSANS